MSTNLTTVEHLSLLASAVKGKFNVLDTLPATMNGGLWFEGSGSVPIIKLYYGGNAFKITPELVAIKATPTLTVTNTRIAPPDSRTTITYNGDGNLYLFDFTGDVQATISGTTLTIANGNGTFKVGATEGTNYAAATPVTVTVTGNGSSTIPTITTDNGNVTLNVLTEGTEATMAIRTLCDEGLNEGNILAHWAENIQGELSGLVDTGSDMFDVVTVQIGGDVPDEPLTVIYNTGYLVFDDGVNYYVIFTTDETFADYTLIEAVGQNDGSITFELPVVFIEAYIDTPMTMIVLHWSD